MNFDPRTEARFEQEEEDEQRLSDEEVVLLALLAFANENGIEA